jgi:hypothetical protein
MAEDEQSGLPITPEQYLANDPCLWACACEIVLQSKDVFSLKNHQYLEKPMRSRARRKCAMKATGMGFSEAMGILPSIHGLIHNRYPQGVIYLFPTNDDVQDYSKSRFDTLFNANRGFIGRFVKPGGKGVDSVKLKKIGNSFLYLRGATLSPEDEGSGGATSTKLSGIQADRVVFDEIHLMNQEAIAKALGRMGHSKVKEEVYIANPGGEDEDINILWKQSDMQSWFRKCLACEEWTCAEEEFPQCVKEYINSAERKREGLHAGYIACKKCGKPVPIYSEEGSGEWVAARPTVTDMEGYSISHLSSTFHDPLDILKRFNNPPQGNIGDVYRLDLGKAYSSLEDKLQINTVLANCGNDLMPDSHTGPCAMGVDVGLTFHVVIGIRTGKERYEVVRVVQVQNFNDVHDLARRYNVKSEVVDIRPYEDSARLYQKGQKQYGSRVYLCQYSENPSIDYDFNDNNGIVTAHRTGIFDKTQRMLINGEIRLPRICPAIREFARQCCNCAKKKKLDKNKQPIYRYEPTGDQQEHYRNALNYFVLAASNNKIRIVKSAFPTSNSEEQFVINDNERYI